MAVALNVLKYAGLILLGGIASFAIPLLLASPYFVWRELRRGVRRKTSAGAGEGASIRARMKRLAQPTFLLAPTNEPGFSKLGGRPELPAAMDWPNGVALPRAFLAQIDLAALREDGGPDWLPAEGRLYAFCDQDRYGFTDPVKILFSSEPPGAEVPMHGSSFPERRVRFLKATSRPSLDWLGIDVSDLNVTEAELDQLSCLPDEPFGDQVQHRIGGYPSEIQESQMQVECEYMRRGLEGDWSDEVPPAIMRASKDWRLLLQIDSDPDLGMSWGDAGRLYVFIRRKDASAGDFSKTVTIFQTH
jgi:uncharacterized protein YwqG